MLARRKSVVVGEAKVVGWSKRETAGRDTKARTGKTGVSTAGLQGRQTVGQKAHKLRGGESGAAVALALDEARCRGIYMQTEMIRDKYFYTQIGELEGKVERRTIRCYCWRQAARRRM